MNTVEAIKKYFNSDILIPCGRPVENREIIGLLKGMPKDEKDELGKQACAALGETWTPSAG